MKKTNEQPPEPKKEPKVNRLTNGPRQKQITKIPLTSLEGGSFKKTNWTIPIKNNNKNENNNENNSQSIQQLESDETN